MVKINSECDIVEIYMACTVAATRTTEFPVVMLVVTPFLTSPQDSCQSTSNIHIVIMILNFEVNKLRKHLVWAIVGNTLFVEVHVYEKSCGLFARVPM